MVRRRLTREALCAARLQIFVDEIDALLRDRSSDSHEVTSTIKAEFLTCVSLVALAPSQRARLLVDR